MTGPFSRILLATEHSDFDRGAETLALEIAHRCSLPLAAVLPVASNPEFEMLAPQLAAKSDAAALAKSEQLRARARGAGVQLELRARHGPQAFEEIVEEACERAADLIVIRRRGRRSFVANLLLGEMVGNVVADAPCSVLIAPRSARLWSRRVLVAVDPVAPDLRVVALAARVALDCGLPMTIVAVCGHDSAPARGQAEAALERAALEAGAIAAQVQTQLSFGRAHEQIAAAAISTAADLVVLGRDGQVRRGRAWFGGVTHKVIGRVELPLLVAVFTPSKEASP